MKKMFFAAIVIASLAACGGKKKAPMTGPGTGSAMPADGSGSGMPADGSGSAAHEGGGGGM